MTEEDNEDSDPGGTSVLRVPCLEYLFGPEWIFLKFEGLNILSGRRRVANFSVSYSVDRIALLGIQGGAP